jgi:type I restriction enzyme M protein
MKRLILWNILSERTAGCKVKISIDDKSDKSPDMFTLAERNKPERVLSKKDLLPINNLKSIFREIRDYFAGNVTGITRDEKIAQNIMRVLFCKIYDEKNTAENEPVRVSNRPCESLDEFQKRITGVFENVKNKYADIFEPEESIEIEPAELAFIISKLECYSILDAERDIIADAFEELIGKTFRGGEGQFFTPRNIVQMMVTVLQPGENERIIDPACGSGGFIAHIVNLFIHNGIKTHNIFGIDKDLFLSRLAKIFLTMLGENEYHIYCENSLERPSVWKDETKRRIQLNSFDVILTNPPFGAKIPVVGDDLLRQFELGHRWKKQKGSWLLTTELRGRQPPQILFIERIIQLLKEGGRAGIVLPEGIFGNPSDRYVWDYIRKYASVLGVVSLAQEAFQPSTHTKTSVLFLEKKNTARKSIFMACAEKIGHNKNGKEMYKLHEAGGFVLNKQGEKIIDDDTREIAKNFTAYLKGALQHESSRGFAVQRHELNGSIFIPEHYLPEMKIKIHTVTKTGGYELVSFGGLVEQKIIEIRRGNEIGSRHYGSGNIPFIRTTDIVNWEIKMDAVKTVSEEVYRKYKTPQDIRENDIFFVNDGTFLIGRSGMITSLDIKSVYQSHIKKIRVLDTTKISPFYLFYVLNTELVREQIISKTFTQATLSTLGDRIFELVLPVHKDTGIIKEIADEIRDIITTKALLRKRIQKILLR